MQQVWCGGEQIGLLKGSQAAKEGDELELMVDGELQNFRVKRAYLFFSESGAANPRLEVVSTDPLFSFG